MKKTPKIIKRKKRKTNIEPPPYFFELSMVVPFLLIIIWSTIWMALVFPYLKFIPMFMFSFSFFMLYMIDKSKNKR